MLLIRGLLGFLLFMQWFLLGVSDPAPLSAYFVVKLRARVWEGLRDLLRFVPLPVTFALFLFGNLCGHFSSLNGSGHLFEPLLLALNSLFIVMSSNYFEAFVWTSHPLCIYFCCCCIFPFPPLSY